MEGGRVEGPYALEPGHPVGLHEVFSVLVGLLTGCLVEAGRRGMKTTRSPTLTALNLEPGQILGSRE